MKAVDAKEQQKSGKCIRTPKMFCMTDSAHCKNSQKQDGKIVKIRENKQRDCISKKCVLC